MGAEIEPSLCQRIKQARRLCGILTIIKSNTSFSFPVLGKNNESIMDDSGAPLRIKVSYGTLRSIRRKYMDTLALPANHLEAAADLSWLKH